MRRAVVAVLVLLVTLVSFAPAAAAQSATDPPAEAGASTASTTTSTPSLLVPGPDAAGAGGPNPAESSSSGLIDADRTELVVGIIVATLLVAGLLIAVGTHRYWRNTKPHSPDAGKKLVSPTSSRHLAKAGR